MIKILHSVKNWFSIFEKITFIRSSSNWRYLLGAGVLILLAGMINYDTRQNQWEHWQDNPVYFYADNKPLVSTTDAGYFLSYAESYQNGDEVDTFKQSRQYPEKTIAFKKDRAENPDQVVENKIHLQDFPLLSVIIAEISTVFFDGDLLTAANAMIPITGFLTAIAVGLMFWAAGYPAEGAIAGTGFGLSTAYLVRTSIGRIDTDQLIIFFVALTITFILLAINQRDYRRMLGFVLLAALSSLSFAWWYPQGTFVIMFPVITGIGIFVARLDLQPATVGFATFVLATNPMYFLKSIYRFIDTFIDLFFKNGPALTPSISTTEGATGSLGGLSFPDTYSTITELAKVNFLETLHFMTSDIIIGVVGCFGFIAFLIMRPSKGLVFLPFFMIGILSVIIGQRFAFYGAPFVWFGAAWVFVSMSRIAAKALNKKSMVKKPNGFAVDGTVLTLSGIAVIMTVMISNIDYVPRLSFSPPVVETMAQMKSLEKNNGGVVATWWDYGYLVHFKSGMNTLHDGGIQETPRTHLIARGFISNNDGELLQILKFVSTEGNAGIRKHSQSLNDLNLAISKAGMPDKTPYILVTDQMQSWFTTISKLGLFNMETGTYPSPQVLNGFHFYNFNCIPAEENKFQCKEGLIDLSHGTIDGKPLIKQSVETVNGKINTYLDYDNDGQYVLLIIRNNGGGIRVKFIPEPTWNSVFNQLYELGVYDENRLELVIDNYPFARVYKILR